MLQIRPAAPLPPLADPLRTTACVLLTTFRHEFEFLAMILRHAGMHLYRADTLEQADFLITVTGARVMLCDTVCPDGTWKECVDMLAREHPGVSLVVLAEKVDAPFVADAIDAGACTVAWAPIGFDFRYLIAAAREAAMERALRQADRSR